MNLFFELVFRYLPILGILICDTQTWKNVNVQCQSCAVFPRLITIALSGSFSAYGSANESSSNLLLLSDHPFASPSSAAQTTDTPAYERDARRRRVRAKWPQLVSRQTPPCMHCYALELPVRVDQKPPVCCGSTHAMSAAYTKKQTRAASTDLLRQRPDYAGAALLQQVTCKKGCDETQKAAGAMAADDKTTLHRALCCESGFEPIAVKSVSWNCRYREKAE